MFITSTKTLKGNFECKLHLTQEMALYALCNLSLPEVYTLVKHHIIIFITFNAGMIVPECKSMSGLCFIYLLKTLNDDMELHPNLTFWILLVFQD